MYYMYEDSYVYIMRMFDGALKVGHAINVQQRRQELSSKGEPALILHVWKANYWYSRWIEHHAHLILRPYRCYGFEYYKTNVKNCVRAIEEAIKRAVDRKEKDAQKMKVKKNQRNITGEPIHA